MKKKIINKNNYEIDLLELLIIISKKKLKILFLTIFIFALSFFFINDNKISQELIFNFKTEIRPISKFEEFKYKKYNSYINYHRSRNKFFSLNPLKNYKDLNEIQNNSPSLIQDFYSFTDLDYSSFEIINKDNLLSLFIELFNENKYESDELYQDVFNKVISSIKLTSKINTANNTTQWYIEYQIEEKNIKNWEKLLRNIEKKINLKIHKYLNNSFNQIISNQEDLSKHKIEDLKYLMSTRPKSSEDYKNLNQLLDYLKLNKDIIRLKEIFNSTPIANSNDFNAVKIDFDISNYKIKNSKKSSQLDKKSQLILSALLGLIISIIYVLLENLVKRRSN